VKSLRSNDKEFAIEICGKGLLMQQIKQKLQSRQHDLLIPSGFLVCTFLLLSILTACLFFQETANKPLSDEELRAKAVQLAQEVIIIDTHVDLPYRLQSKMEDISIRTEGGNFDYERAKEGGLNAPFMSIFVSSRMQEKGQAKKHADELIDLVEKIVMDHSDKFDKAKSPEEVKEQFKRGIISFPMGMENGAPVEDDLANLKHFYDRGISYITLTHSENNHISDSSFAEERPWEGLSPFGKEVVEEMNRLGIMVDITHVSDKAFYQVMEISKAPVIASHSSCRAFTPEWERNMSDEMIELMASKGGVIQINFGSMFLLEESLNRSKAAWEDFREYMKEHELSWRDEKMREYRENYFKENPRIYGHVSDVVKHIDHVVQLVGIDHVGLGSDFEGVGDSLPEDLKSVADYPNIIYELIKKGYTEEDIRKICGENLLRVWKEVRQIAEDLQSR
jgi:membrane dipeptidase